MHLNQEGYLYRFFVDSKHASDRVTRISLTVILLYFNSAPIFLYYKRENTVESSTVGLDAVAFKIIVLELIISIRYKLRISGITIIRPANVFYDNEAVYRNSTFSESKLRRKHKSI